MKIILTGATGMVGEGVLFECLENKKVTEILMLNRRHYSLSHTKLKEIIIPDFLDIENYTDKLKGYDACFYCAGISSIGLNENKFTTITFDTTIKIAETLLKINPNLIFTYVTGSGTDSTEKGKIMWARVKGKTENTLNSMPFKANYNFRPAVMLPYKGQKNWKKSYKILAKIISFFAPKSVLTIKQVGKAMINMVENGYPSKTLEIKDIFKASQG
jgi:uncharacterized protein YbjT (DUF2867 family)